MRKTNRFAVFIGLSGILFLLVFALVLVSAGVFNQGEITWYQYIKTSAGLSNTTFLTGKTLKTPPYVLLLIVIMCLAGSLMAIFNGLNKENLGRFFFGLTFLLFGIAASFFFHPLISGFFLLMGVVIVIGCLRQVFKIK